MNIGFFEVRLQEEKDYFTNNLKDHNLSFFAHPINSQNVLEATNFDLVSTFVNCKMDKAIIDSLPNLKGIFARSTGIDVIDVNYASQKGIKVYNVPTYGSHTVAEFTFALILALMRNIPEAVKRTREERKFYFDGLCGFDLVNKTIGIIGTGKIGENVVKIAKGFGMNILAYDLYPKQELVTLGGVKYDSLENVLKNSDVISLHAPATKENYHLINADNIKLIKSGAYLINTARGSLIDIHPLIEALNNKQIAGAALDVLEGEQTLKEEAELFNKETSAEEYRKILENQMLFNLPNVIVTPHLAFYSKEAQQSILETVVKNINAFVAGSDINLVK